MNIQGQISEKQWTSIGTGTSTSRSRSTTAIMSWLNSLSSLTSRGSLSARHSLSSLSSQLSQFSEQSQISGLFRLSELSQLSTLSTLSFFGWFFSTLHYTRWAWDLQSTTKQLEGDGRGKLLEAKCWSCHILPKMLCNSIPLNALPVHC